MATLYVENIPDDLYDALRKRARSQHRSIAAEIRTLLEENIPTEKELKRRRQCMLKLNRLSASAVRTDGTFPTSEEMIREDRAR
jgi:plasmid stability protein